MKHLIVLIGKDDSEIKEYAKKLGTINNCIFSSDDNLHPYFTRNFVRGIIRNFNSYIIITNSPYVLGEINNILYAQDVAKRFPHNAESVKKIIPEDLWIEKCEAFEIVNGEPVDIFDYELNLINDGALDNETSSRINNEFDDISDFDEYDGDDEEFKIPENCVTPNYENKPIAINKDETPLLSLLEKITVNKEKK